MPPAAVTVAEPFDPPKQLTLVWAVMLDVNADAGWVMVALVVVVHPPVEVTVTVQVPAVRAVAVAVVWAGAGSFHK